MFFGIIGLPMKKEKCVNFQDVYWFKSLILCAFMAVSPKVLSTELITPQKLSIAAIDWCPHVCLSKERPGYIVEIVKEVFSGGKYQLQIDFFPWSRAIRNVTSGQYHALLAPAKKEAPNLIYPANALGFQKMCFFVDKNSDWQYKNPKSLQGLAIGIASDSSIEELNAYIIKKPEQFQFQPYHERFVKQNALKVLKKRIDTFIFTLNATLYTLKREGLHHKIKNVGCISKAEIYMAFTPIGSERSFINEVVTYFEQRMSELHENGRLEEIRKKYDAKLSFET